MSLKEIYAPNRAAWRSWLKKNHDKEKRIWLVLHKKHSNVPCVKLDEAVEEALCFGWIDSKPNKRDENYYVIMMAARKKGSVWSRINKGRIARLIRDGLMTKEGLRKISEAKRDGSWNKLDAVDALEMPVELRTAFSKAKKARAYFEKFPPGVKKIIYSWIYSAKRVETKKDRVRETVSKAARNERANQWKPKK